jgi:hypothetical protein
MKETPREISADQPKNRVMWRGRGRSYSASASLKPPPYFLADLRIFPSVFPSCTFYSSFWTDICVNSSLALVIIVYDDWSL